MYLIWLDARLNSRAGRQPHQRLGTFRSSWHLTRAMFDAFEGEDLDVISDKQMDEKLKGESMMIAVDGLPESRKVEKRNGSSGAKKRRWGKRKVGNPFGAAP